MRLYNTLTRQVDEVKPQEAPEVTVYTCGPTVYDYPHAGNWFTFIRYDLLIRVLKATGFRPKWVMNITDVGHLVSDADEGEDKLEKGAKREGKTAWQVAEFYTDYFHAGLHRINSLTPDYLPKATDHVPEQIELIKTLEQKGYTYVIDDGVYFDASKFKNYASLARLDLEKLQAGARVENNKQKRQASDFALWKFSPKDKKRDMEWASPWGRGFPGWHLECSAMAIKYLGETIDIHAGGIDHLSVHHTNEIAQSEAATGKPFVNYWLHVNHISVSGEKISKSLDNSITLEDIEAKGYSLEAFRLLVLESHYQTQSKFSWEGLEAAQNRLKGFQALADLRYQLDPDAALLGDDYFQEASRQLTNLLADDLGTPQLLAHLNDIFLHIEKYGQGIHPQHADNYVQFLQQVDLLTGINLLASKDITEEQKQLLAQRQSARSVQDWAESDRLRDALADEGVAIKDTKDGQIWSRV